MYAVKIVFSKEKTLIPLIYDYCFFIPSWAVYFLSQVFHSTNTHMYTHKLFLCSVNSVRR